MRSTLYIIRFQLGHYEHNILKSRPIRYRGASCLERTCTLQLDLNDPPFPI